MRRFERELAKRSSATGCRRWFFVPEDQLTDAIGPLSREQAGNAGVVLVESAWKAGRRPYHRQKLALIWTNLRHFALEQAGRGVAVRYLFTTSSYRDTLSPLVDELGPLILMEPAERELRADLAPLVSSGGLRVVPHEGWLTTREQFTAGTGTWPPWRMDRFYRQVRGATGLLMNGRAPLGGKFSFDPENRLPWKGYPPAPRPLRWAFLARHAPSLKNNPRLRLPLNALRRRLDATVFTAVQSALRAGTRLNPRSLGSVHA